MKDQRNVCKVYYRDEGENYPAPMARSTVFTIFSAFLAVCAILGLNFAVKAYRQRGRLKNLMQKIREYQTLPLGEKGGELGAAELGNLPSEEGGEAR
jgi:hypothetical protein